MDKQSIPYFRFVGFLPFTFFLAQIYRYYPDGLSNMLWMCNINNLLLAIGLWFRIDWLIRLTAIWTIPGVVIWVLFDVLISHIVLSSFLAHICTFFVAFYTLSKIGASRQMALHAIIWHFVLQLSCRFITPPEFNVNVAHSVHGGLNKAFDAYWKFWLTSLVVVIIGMFILQWILLKIFPEKTQNQSYETASMSF
jgi:hypothetical protein